jgi:hypothetical protein
LFAHYYGGSGQPKSARADFTASNRLALIVVAGGMHGTDKISLDFDPEFFRIFGVKADAISAMSFKLFRLVMLLERLRQIFSLAHIEGLVPMLTRILMRSIRDDV